MGTILRSQCSLQEVFLESNQLGLGSVHPPLPPTPPPPPQGKSKPYKVQVLLLLCPKIRHFFACSTKFATFLLFHLSQMFPPQKFTTVLPVQPNSPLFCCSHFVIAALLQLLCYFSNIFPITADFSDIKIQLQICNQTVSLAPAAAIQVICLL